LTALLLAVIFGGAHWLPDTGGGLDYVKNVGLTAAVLAPAALAEEVAFRGFPLVFSPRSSVGAPRSS
jgi:hypothetical protein